MPPPIPVVLATYDPRWPEMAETLSSGLKKLGSQLVYVHHIGSTAVPGLSAKPIIDLMPVVTGLENLDSLRGLIERLGFEWHGELGIEGRRYCTLTRHNRTRVAQLHIFSVGSPHIDRHLAFRNYLRTHPESASRPTRKKRSGPESFTLTIRTHMRMKRRNGSR